MDVSVDTYIFSYQQNRDIVSMDYLDCDKYNTNYVQTLDWIGLMLIPSYFSRNKF